MLMPDLIYAIDLDEGKRQIWRDFEFADMPNDFTLLAAEPYARVPEGVDPDDAVAALKKLSEKNSNGHD